MPKILAGLDRLGFLAITDDGATSSKHTNISAARVFVVVVVVRERIVVGSVCSKVLGAAA